MRNVDLGCGLIAIGREWGKTPRVPTSKEARTFLEFAFTLGIRKFDTAPSYGLSEARLGRFLSDLTEEERSEIVVSTKFGEHWDRSKSAPFTDHSYASLRESLNRSLERLGRIDLLFLHKSRPELLQNDDVNLAWEYARRLGIAMLGVSVSDLETAEAALANDRFQAVQVPLNQSNQQFKEIIESAHSKGKIVYVNRPLQMGAAVQSGDKVQQLHDAFAQIFQTQFSGTVLSGTANPKHLEENLHAFRAAHAKV